VRREAASLRQRKGVGEAEDLAGFGGGNAGVGGEAVEVVEAVARRPGGEAGLAEVGKALLETFEGNTGAWIARGHGTTGTRIAAF